jgi:hypothetical protein
MVVKGARAGFGRGLTMRSAALVAVMLGLAACAPSVPPQGAGFSDFGTYQRNREAQLTGTLPPPTGFDPARVGAAIDAADRPVGAPLNAITPGAPVPLGSSTGAVIGADPFDPNRPRGNAPIGITETMSEMGGNVGISDEQDFTAVAPARDHRKRCAAHRAQPGAVSGGGTHCPAGAVGQHGAEHRGICAEPRRTPLASRCTTARASGSTRRKRPARAIARLTLRRRPSCAGGPRRDPLGLDPDGDGFACAWDPTPFRTALQ